MFSIFFRARKPASLDVAKVIRRRVASQCQQRDLFDLQTGKLKHVDFIFKRNKDD